jgi:hypothetical protein
MSPSTSMSITGFLAGIADALVARDITRELKEP